MKFENVFFQIPRTIIIMTSRFKRRRGCLDGRSKEGWGWLVIASAGEMGAGASMKRSPSSLIAEIDKLRERELNTKVGRSSLHSLHVLLHLAI